MFTTIHGQSQNNPDPVTGINVGYNNDFSGFEMIEVAGNNAFIITEDVHNRANIPAVTLKFLKFLNKHKNIKTLAIEGGTSTAYLINRYLENQDSSLLREIVRHTFYWSQEHYQFLKALAAWNHTLSAENQIVVQSADIEIKQESVILAINLLIDEKKIPPQISVLETFKIIFKEREQHRNSFQALNVLYYYDKKKCSNLVETVLADVKANPGEYKKFFMDNFELFNTMVTDLQLLYKFNYHRDSRFKFRDDIIYQKLLKVHKISLNGFLYVVGAKHARPDASSFMLKHYAFSPLKDKVLFISTTGKNKNGKYLGAKDVTKISNQYPQVFNSKFHTLIKNDCRNELFTQPYDYTLALKDNRHVKPFPNSFTGK